MNFCFYSKYNGKSTIEQLRRVTFLFPPRHFILSTIFSDIVRRNQVKKIDQLERVVKYTFNNIGNTFSAKSISNYFKSEQRKIDNETVHSYLEKLQKAYILHKCS